MPVIPATVLKRLYVKGSLRVKDGVIGALQVVDTEIDRFSTADLTLLEPLVSFAAIAIENARLYEQAQQDAEIKSVLLQEVNHRVKNNLTGILGPASRVTALSGLVLPEREFRGRTISCDMDDSTLMLLDFGQSCFAFVYGTVAGSVNQGFQPNIYGNQASIVGTDLGEQQLKLPDDHQPHVVGEHTGMPESHVFEDLMQLVDWVRDGEVNMRTLVTHVIPLEDVPHGLWLCRERPEETIKVVVDVRG